MSKRPLENGEKLLHGAGNVDLPAPVPVEAYLLGTQNRRGIVPLDFHQHVTTAPARSLTYDQVREAAAYHAANGNAAAELFSRAREFLLIAIGARGRPGARHVSLPVAKPLEPMPAVWRRRRQWREEYLRAWVRASQTRTDTRPTESPRHETRKPADSDRDSDGEHGAS